MTRRQFATRSGLVGAGLLLSSMPRLKGASPQNRIVAGVMGTNGRGLAHIQALLAQSNVEIAYVCDVDERAVKKGLQAAAAQKQPPKGVTDFRRILEDKDVDVLAIAAPNHWHAPATILACQAGKHVYVEKPGSHNGHEGEMMVAAARVHQRQVQLGTQRRSWPWIQEAMERLHTGAIGRLTFARAWYNNARVSIGRGKRAAVPEWLDFDLWQGPAPERPYKDNLVHYNWHWHWHWGGGELANNGVHALDLVRWGLQVDFPRGVTCSGGRFHYQDDQETPDTTVTTFDFGDKGATWEGHSCHPRGFEGAPFGVTFYGTGGTLVITANKYTVYDGSQKKVAEITGPGGDGDHFANFLEAIRSGKPLHAGIDRTYQSAQLCHLGNIAFRTATALALDPATGRIQKNREAKGLWSREYRRGWAPKV